VWFYEVALGCSSQRSILVVPLRHCKVSIAGFQCSGKRLVAINFVLGPELLHLTRGDVQEFRASVVSSEQAEKLRRCSASSFRV